jgi:two-component system sensor histidine kinase CpxA
VLFTGTAHITLRSNRDLLTSAVENVLRNAVRYSPQDGLVDVSVERADAAGLSIVIRDRGPGVPGGDLERIFEPFYRVAESRDRATGGEGIGLAITAQVMKTHGGSAKASNLAGGGLEVRLNLPRSALAAS